MSNLSSLFTDNPLQVITICEACSSRVHKSIDRKTLAVIDVFGSPCPHTEEIEAREALAARLAWIKEKANA